MKNNAEITQLVFNIKTIDWKLDLHIRGCNNTIKITADEASSIINSLQQDEADRMEILVEKDKEKIYYMPKPKRN